jgi:hypothetical protein
MKKQTLFVALTLSTFFYAQVGINTNTPSAELDVISKGNTSSTKALKITNSSNNEMMTVLNNGNVGIGNTAPTTKLDINNGTNAGAIKIVDGTQGAGRVLTSDANGVGSWSPTPVTALYFLSSSPYTGSTDFTGTTNPVTGATTSTARYLSTGTITNLGPTTTFTSGSVGLSYRIPVNGLYRLTLYVDSIPTGGTIAIDAYRNGARIYNNGDMGNNLSPLTMINIWNLQAGDYVFPYSSAGATGSQMVETTFTVERVN